VLDYPRSEMGFSVPLFIGGVGPPEMVLVLLIAVLLFGANKIPKLARSTGQALGEFQRGREEIEQELEDVRQSANESVEAATNPDTSATSSGSANAQGSTESSGENQTGGGESSGDSTEQ